MKSYALLGTGIVLTLISLGGCPAATDTTGNENSNSINSNSSGNSNTNSGSDTNENTNSSNNSNDNTNSSGGDSSDRIGQTAPLTGFYHNVSGTARIVDERTIAFENFTYDGGGPDVRIYGDTSTSFSSPVVLSGDIGGHNYVNETLTVTLPDGVTLDDINAVAVWCVIFDIDFGHGTFQ